MWRPELSITKDMNASKCYVVKITVSLRILLDDAHYFVGFLVVCALGSEIRHKFVRGQQCSNS